MDTHDKRNVHSVLFHSRYSYEYKRPIYIFSPSTSWGLDIYVGYKYTSYILFFWA